jgi:transposase
MATKSDHEQKHGALVARRNQLLELINQESNRLKQAWDDDAKQSIRNVMDVLKNQLKDIDSKLAKMLQVDTENQRTIEVLKSVKGVGPVMISTVLAELPPEVKGERVQGGDRGLHAKVHQHPQSAGQDRSTVGKQNERLNGLPYKRSQTHH